MDQHQRTWDAALADLKRQLVHMAAVAETMIDASIAELVNRDEHLAEKIPELENDLNRMQIEVDDAALTLLATQQPVAKDLRFIMAATRINGELERIGDLVVNITENTEVLLAQPPLKPLIDIPHMADITRQMVRQSLEAFLREDPLLAQSVILTDDQVDGFKDQILRELLTYMMADPRTIERGLALILVARHLERMADHATNIAQNVIYLCQGRDVRHPKIQKDTPPA
ncbi:MAG TPA: phosphate signaling complex protein PhoU [Phycisphaerae bacterium]|nr:phosphate signaling complex protein PhoU [Phycisphaerae bacterium]